MKPIGAMLFDLDGTLIDSAPDLVAALNWVRASEGLPELGVREMSPHVSRGAAGLIGAGMPAADASQVEIWKSLFLARYADHSFNQSSLFPGVAELLLCLEEGGIPWGIVTNKSEALTVPILRSANLLDRLSCLVCGDTLSRNKPDPAPVILACEMVKTPTDRALFAGDDLRDLQAGRAAGTMTAAVHYGYGLFDLDDHLVSSSVQIHHPADLAGLLEQSLTP